MKKRIALCIGHNKVAQGAVGNMGISEYDFNKEFVEELIPMLRDTGHEYKIFFRPPGGSYGYQQNVMHANIAECGNVDYAIEFHFNAAESDAVSGHEILYLSKNGKKLAQKLDAQFDKYLNTPDRGIKKRKSGNVYGFLKRGSYASIIVEPFFAAHQDNFVVGGNKRDALLQAYVKFFKTV